MESRIATLLDQSPYKKLTLDPSVLTTTATAAPRHVEPAAGTEETHTNQDSYSHHDHVDTRNKIGSQAHSSAPIARVLNDPASSSNSFQPTPGRQPQQHAAFLTRNEGPALGPTAISPDARRRDDNHSSIGYSGGDISLIQLPKPPQAPRKPAKRPRIPPLLQGLHQPPPLPPKSRLFPPITSDRTRLGNDVGDRFTLGSTFSTGNTEDLVKARASPQKEKEVNQSGVGATTTGILQDASQEHESRIDSTEDSLPPAQTTSRGSSKVKAPRKRTRWSQKETEDLLTGVSKFGIGRWKQILECEDFHFQGRTAVDLKDRFRVCRPGEGLKARKAATPEDLTMSRSTEAGQPDQDSSYTLYRDVVAQNVPSDQQTTLDDTDSIDQGTTNKTEIYGPFLKSKRRARREFSNADDKNLLKGFKRHGPIWHSMRDDFELGFGMRHPTDLRDRFRIRYPDLFAQAGYKLKPKEERALKDREDTKAKEAQALRQPATTRGKTSDKIETLDKSAAHTSVSGMPSIPSVATLVPVATTSQADSVRPTFDLITDLTFDDDEGDRSPIVLNRNILQWADENSAVLPSTPATSTSTQTAMHVASDLLYNPSPASDGLHINPLATLKLPSTAHWSYMNPPASAAAPSLPPPAPLKHSLPANSATPSLVRTQQAMRTPNLPNIVFPYVPSASARNAVHNLPAPADILSSGQAGSSDNHIWIG